MDLDLKLLVGESADTARKIRLVFSAAKPGSQHAEQYLNAIKLTVKSMAGPVARQPPVVIQAFEPPKDSTQKLSR